MWLESLIAFNLGLFSSLHCIGMCGGIITVLMRGTTPEQSNKRHIFSKSLAYNLGRISSYSLAGLFAGLFGAGLLELMAEYQAHLILQSVAAAILVLLALNIVGIVAFSKRLEGLGMKLWRYLQPLGQRLLPVDSFAKAWLFGMVWGWLPCGLVYSALLFSITAGTAAGGFMLMLSFGLGTIPAMLAAGYFIEYLQRLTRKKHLRWASALLLILMAVSLPLSSWYFASHHAQQKQEETTHQHHHH